MYFAGFQTHEQPNSSGEGCCKITWWNAFAAWISIRLVLFFISYSQFGPYYYSNFTSLGVEIVYYIICICINYRICLTALPLTLALSFKLSWTCRQYGTCFFPSLLLCFCKHFLNYWKHKKAFLGLFRNRGLLWMVS